MNNTKWIVPDPKDGVLNIAIDKDNTLADLTMALEVYAYRKSGRIDVYDFKSQKDYHVNTWGTPFNLGDAFKEKGFFKNLEPFPFATQAVCMLSMLHDVFVCSSPNSSEYEYSAKEKTHWVKYHLGKVPLVLCDDKTRINCDILIDDRPSIKEKGKISHDKVTWEHVVFDRPYNRGYAQEKGLSVVTDWSDVVTQCKTLLEERRRNDQNKKIKLTS